VEYDGRKLFKYKIDKSNCVFTLVKQSGYSDQKILGREKYQLSAIAGGEEVPFVAVLHFGRYTFRDFEIKIFGDPIRGQMLVSFDVVPGKTTYIGKLSRKAILRESILSFFALPP
jgi:hypothetical protein